MLETLRLMFSVSCPKCSFLVKPFIISKFDDGIKVQCPKDNCKHEFILFNEQ